MDVILKYSKLIFVWGVVFALISGGVSLLWPKQYSASSQVLIISRDRTGIDPYTQAKSAERIGANLSQVMKTTDFYNKTMESAGVFDRGRWQKLNDRNQRKRWQKDVQASMVYNSGLMNIVVYSVSQDDALALAQAVNETVVSRGWEYVGSDVTLKAVNAPLVSRFPARPNFPLNIVIGFAFGLLLGALWVKRYKHSMFGV